MPYIPQMRRVELLECHDAPKSQGELNFLITEQLARYCRAHGLSYITINDCLGALNGATLEFYRRKAAPYEDLACQRNGDVYA